MGQCRGRSGSLRPIAIEGNAGGPSASTGFERPLVDGQSTVEVELIGLKQRANKRDKYARTHPGVFEKRKRKRLQTREDLIRLYVTLADNEDTSAADRIRAADRLVDLLGFKISKDYDSVQSMTTNELTAAVEKVAPLIESYMSHRAKGSSVTQTPGTEP